MREKLYASRVAKRAITIADVPQKYRDGVMALLDDAERERQQRILDEQDA